MKKIFLFNFVFFALNSVFASTSLQPSELKFHLINKAATPAPLKESDERITSRTRRLTKNFLEDKGIANNAILLINNEVTYKLTGKDAQPQMLPGTGISRSLLGMVIGKLFCDRKINSLDDKLRIYLPSLKNTSWGDASIRNLLLMKSGANLTHLLDHGFVSDKNWSTFNNGNTNWVFSKSFEELLIDSDDKAYKNGEAWNYSSLDSIALGLLAEKLTGNKFIEYFVDSIWSKIGAEHESGWVTNLSGQALYYSGFHAHLDDWAKFGLWTLEQVELNDDCFKDFLSTSLKSEVATATTVKYGFHKWVNCGPYIDFCFIGEGGQYLLFHRKSKTIMFATSSDELKALYLPAVFQEFITWENLD